VCVRFATSFWSVISGCIVVKVGEVPEAAISGKARSTGHVTDPSLQPAIVIERVLQPRALDATVPAIAQNIVDPHQHRNQH